MQLVRWWDKKEEAKKYCSNKTAEAGAWWWNELDQIKNHENVKNNRVIPISSLQVVLGPKEKTSKIKIRAEKLLWKEEVYQEGFKLSDKVPQNGWRGFFFPWGRGTPDKAKGGFKNRGQYRYRKKGKEKINFFLNCLTWFWICCLLL